MRPEIYVKFAPLRPMGVLMSRMPALAAMAALVLAMVPIGGRAHAADPHQLYEQRCQKCHFEHAADLARQKLRSIDNALQVTRTAQPVERLLRSHHGERLTAGEIAALSELFSSGLRWNGVYQHRCRRCHERAVTFARTRLKLEGDRLATRANDRDVDTFLLSHGDAGPEEIATLLEMFRFQLRTQPGP